MQNNKRQKSMKGMNHILSESENYFKISQIKINNRQLFVEQTIETLLNFPRLPQSSVLDQNIAKIYLKLISALKVAAVREGLRKGYVMMFKDASLWWNPTKGKCLLKKGVRKKWENICNQYLCIIGFWLVNLWWKPVKSLKFTVGVKKANMKVNMLLS